LVKALCHSGLSRYLEALRNSHRGFRLDCTCVEGGPSRHSALPDDVLAGKECTMLPKYHRSTILLLITVVIGTALPGIVLGQLPATRNTIGARAGEERDDNGLQMKLGWCPPGTFNMGSPQSEADRYDNEAQVPVTLTQGFWLGKYEVTQGEWERVMRTTPWRGQKSVKEGPRYAATHISWEEATEFARRLTEQEREAGRLPKSLNYTLPTEAQWEYACRAGTKTAYSFGDNSAMLSEYDWWSGNTDRQQYAHEVGLKKPNAWGFYDTHGNVAEWCRDWYANQLPGGNDPEVTTEGTDRVFRGGSWRYRAGICRAAARRQDTPGVRSKSNRLGFRLALSFQE